MVELVLQGIRPEPLAGYLKAMALLRILGEQVDAGSTGAWRGDCFVIRSPMGEAELVHFFMEKWAPSPMLSPWNGSSGFGGDGAQEGIQAIRTSTDDRFATWRQAIDVAERLARASAEAVEAKRINAEGAKRALALQLRSELPDSALAWMDASFVLTADGRRFPPLLGTGGNIGRLELANNQMQRIAELLLDPAGRLDAPGRLRGALFGEPAKLVRDLSIGQYDPGHAGGSNTGFGFDRDSLINPWDFVLALEGTLTFASAATRVLEHDAARAEAAFPFFVRATSAGYGSASHAELDSSKGEAWMPVWDAFATAAEVGALAAEGRSWTGRKQASTGADFARAIRNLGIARGVTAFHRFAIHQRHGQAFLAVPVGRFVVNAAPEPDLIAHAEPWLERVGRAAKEERCPAGVRHALQRFETALLSAKAASNRQPRVLLALGALAEACARSRAHATMKYVQPLSPLPEGMLDADQFTGDPAWRLALSAAAAGLRPWVQPVSAQPPLRWVESSARRRLSATAPVIDRLLLAGQERLHNETATWAFSAKGGHGVGLSDLIALVDDQIGDSKLGEALDAALLTTGGVARRDEPSEFPTPLPLALALCICAVHGPSDETKWPVPTQMLTLLAAGRGEAAIARAVQHLTAHGTLESLFVAPTVSPNRARRIAAALVLPLAASAKRAAWHAISSPTAALSRNS